MNAMHAMDLVIDAMVAVVAREAIIPMEATGAIVAAWLSRV